MFSWKRVVSVLVLCMMLALVPAVAHAAQATSPSYSVDEVFFGSGGELNACSATYCAKQSAGETTVGNTASSNFQAQTGFNSNRNEYIEFTVDPTNINLGVLSSGSAKTGTATFHVKAYLASGYDVVTASDSPVNGGYHLNPLASQTASTPGTEQFGINLVANTSPTTFGADPVQVPDNTFSFGQVATGYNTANQYKYVKGQTIAQSTKSSGQTDYTISYLFNISGSTPAGTYTMNHVLVATAKF